ncbi:hypothetical protein K1719_020121 [Acacia pycnantha]|nr:hypothetical protein K1719_020121 [Acacia pycnantha]
MFQVLKNEEPNDLVLAAHPTLAVRRSLLQKHSRIRNCLNQIYAMHVTPDDKKELDEALQWEIQAAFRTDEIRRRDVCLLATMMAANLYFSQIEYLMFELSMWRCNEELRARAHQLHSSSKRDAKHFIEFWKQTI